ncbi:hypothetical protein GE09DRAFT_55760 [Coniochaeta sp. 2T2.1]|nr:hypothetical protein GE09DRAFT_55760 [Coniochaeta sp. 2T2.1]
MKGLNYRYWTQICFPSRCLWTNGNTHCHRWLTASFRVVYRMVVYTGVCLVGLGVPSRGISCHDSFASAIVSVGWLVCCYSRTSVGDPFVTSQTPAEMPPSRTNPFVSCTLWPAANNDQLRVRLCATCHWRAAVFLEINHIITRPARTVLFASLRHHSNSWPFALDTSVSCSSIALITASSEHGWNGYSIPGLIYRGKVSQNTPVPKPAVWSVATRDHHPSWS